MRLNLSHKNPLINFMYASILIFSFIAVAFSLALMFSKNFTAFITNINSYINVDHENGSKLQYWSNTKGGAQNYTFVNFIPSVNFLLVTPNLKDSTIGANIFIFAPTLILICYIPFILGVANILVVAYFWIRNRIGFKVFSRRRILIQTNAVKNYTIIYIVSIILFVLLVIFEVIACLASAPALIGHLIGFNFKGFKFETLGIVSSNPTDASLFLTNFEKLGLFWIDPKWLAKSTILNTTFSASSWSIKFNYEAFTLPYIPSVVGLLLALIGVFLGGLSWGRMNLYVSCALGDEKSIALYMEKMKNKKMDDVFKEWKNERGIVKVPNIQSEELEQVKDELTGEFDPQNNEDLLTADVNNVLVNDAKEAKKARKRLKQEKRNRKRTMQEVSQNNASAISETNNVNLERNSSNTKNIEVLLSEFEVLVKNMIDYPEISKSFSLENDMTGENDYQEANSNLLKGILSLLESRQDYNSFYNVMRAIRHNKEAVGQSRRDIEIQKKLYTLIQQYLFISTYWDVNFIRLIENIIDKNYSIFQKDGIALSNLIEKYKNAARSLDFIKQEIILEQIFVIASKNDYVLAKVGFCLKKRLQDQFVYIEKDKYLAKLYYQKEQKSFDEYRSTCLDLLFKMSTNKSSLNNTIYLAMAR